MVPQLLLTLSPNGELIAELPGLNGARRKVEIQAETCYDTITRILHSQLKAKNPPEIGTDGAPTARQVNHWDRHGDFPDRQCVFCLSENRFKTPEAKKLPNRRVSYVGDGSVKVTRCPGKGKVVSKPGKVVSKPKSVGKELVL
jgi:hypothetical protein